MSTLTNSQRAAVQMVLVTLLWAAFFVSGKLAVAEAGPLAVAALRFAMAGTVLAVWLVAKEKGAFRLSGKDWVLALGLGATGVVAYNWLTFVGLTLAPATDGAMISPSLNPVLTVLLAALWFHEPLVKRKMAGIVLAIGGLALIFGGPMLAADTTPGRLLGDLLLLGSGVAWSAYTLIGKAAAGRFSSLASTTYGSVLGGLMLLPLAWGPLQAVKWSALTPAFWGHITFLALGSTIAAFMLFQSTIRLVGAANTVSYLPLIPIFGVLMGVIFLHERPGPLQVAGLAVAIAGVWLANRPARASS